MFHPVRILNGVIQQAIDDGFVEPLLHVGDQYWQHVRAGIKTAKSCVSIDNFLDKLYELVPRAHGAHLIYVRLAEIASRLPAEQASLVRGRVDSWMATQRRKETQ